MKTTFLTLISFFLILAFTVSLNDFSSQSKLGGYSNLFLHSSKFSDLDIALNVLLFVPFGFSLAQLLTKWLKWQPSYRLAAVTFVGLGVSYLVEFFQAFTSTRMPSLFDVLSNTAGSFLGVICYSAYEAKSIKLALVLYAGAVFIFSALLQHNTTLRNWDSSFLLVLGNERTGDRPWRGRIFELRLFDSALSQKVVGRESTKNEVLAPTENILASLRWKIMGDDPGMPGIGIQKLQYDKGITTKPGQWFESATPPTSLSERLKKRSEFTLLTTVATDDPNQMGPARIISLSKDANNRNFTLAQGGRDLVFRLRTPVTGENGTNPDLRIPAVFSTSDRKSIAVTYDGSSLTVYIDGVRQLQNLTLTPGYVALTYLPLSPLLKVDTQLCDLLYYLITFLPMGILIRLSSMSRVGRTMLRVTTVLILCLSVGLEAVLIAVSGKPFSYSSVAVAALSSGSGAFFCEVLRGTRKALRVKRAFLDESAS